VPTKAGNRRDDAGVVEFQSRLFDGRERGLDFATRGLLCRRASSSSC